jgi:hypothetical protein
MGRTKAQENAKYLLRELLISDPGNVLRTACAHIRLCVSELRAAQKLEARGDSAPLDKIAASLEARGVAPEVARRICGFPALESDALKRRRNGATEAGAGSSKAARATTASEESESDAESEGV